MGRFGLTDAQIARARRRRDRPRWGRTAMVVACFAFWLGGLHGVDLLTTSGALSDTLQPWISGGRHVVRFDTVELFSVGDAWNPADWRVRLTGLSVTPKDARRPRWSIRAAVAHVPSLQELWRQRTLALGEVWVAGLRIHAPQQRPPDPWTPRDLAVARIRADRVRVWGAHYTAAADPPIGASRAEGVWATLTDVVYATGTREVSGRGSMTARRFETGNLEVDAPRLEPFVLDRSSLGFEGTFTWGRSEGKVRGAVDTFHIRSTVRLDVEIERANVGEVVRAATGSATPLDGLLSATLEVRAGGDLPRGGGWMEGDVAWTDGRLRIDRQTTKPFFVDLLRIAPYLRVNARHEVLLSDMKGRLRVQRGEVELKELVYEAGPRDLTVRGRIGREELYLVVRMVPLREPHLRSGMGLVLYGDPDRPRFRLADKYDLLPDRWPREEASLEVAAEEPADDAERPRERRRRKARRRE